MNCIFEAACIVTSVLTFFGPTSIVIMLLKVLSYRAQQDRQLVLVELKDMSGWIGTGMSLLADTDLTLASWVEVLLRKQVVWSTGTRPSPGRRCWQLVSSPTGRILHHTVVEGPSVIKEVDKDGRWWKACAIQWVKGLLKLLDILRVRGKCCWCFSLVISSQVLYTCGYRTVRYRHQEQQD